MRYLLVLLLAGCASGEHVQHFACVVPVSENAGMGIRVDRCAVWTIGNPGQSQNRRKLK